MFSLVALSSLGLMLGASTSEAQAPAIELVQTQSGRWVAQPFLALVEDLEEHSIWGPRFEEVAATELRLPAGISFELTDRYLHVEADTLVAVGRLAFAGAPRALLQFHFALSLDWARIGSASLIAEHPRSHLGREQRDTHLYYCWEAFAEVLLALQDCVARLRERCVDIRTFFVTTGESFGPRPFLRVDTEVRLNGTSGQRESPCEPTDVRIQAILPLPALTAQAGERPPEDHERHDGNHPLMGEVTSSLAVGKALDQARAVVVELSELPGHSTPSGICPFGSTISFSQDIPTAGGRDALFFLSMDRPAGEPPWIHWRDFRLEFERTRFVLDFAKRFADAHRQQLAFAAVFPGADPSMRCTIVVATTPIYDHHLEARSARVLQFDVPDDASPIQVRRAIEAEVHCRGSLGEYLWTATLKGGKTFSVEREYSFLCGLGVTWPPEATFDGRAGILVGGTTFTVCEPE